MLRNVEVMKCVVIVPVKYKPGVKKTHEEAAHAVRSVFSSSADFRDSADDLQFCKDPIPEENEPWESRDLASRVGRAPSALQPVQKHFQA